MNAYDTKNNSVSVMVVNDDPLQLRILCELLRKANLEPIPYDSAEAALTTMGNAASALSSLTCICQELMGGVFAACCVLRNMQHTTPFQSL